MNENELGKCRKAFEAVYKRASEFWTPVGYSHPMTNSIWDDWKRSWEACRTHYLHILDEAKLAQYDLHEQLYQQTQNNIRLKEENLQLVMALHCWEMAEKEGAHYEHAQQLRDRCLGLPSAQETPDMKGVERGCCGTFFGTPHRSTCEKFKGKKTPNVELRGRPLADGPA